MESGNGWEGSHVTSFAYRKNFGAETRVPFTPFPFLSPPPCSPLLARSAQPSLAQAAMPYVLLYAHLTSHTYPY
jgi:hypothetical protein